MKAFLNVAFVLFFVFMDVFQPASALDTPKAKFVNYCKHVFTKKGKCPAKICQLQCQDKTLKVKDCEQICVPSKCTDIRVRYCPKKFCAVMIDCSNEKICHYQMGGGKAECGDLAYAGQDVDCCPGLVRRCGIEFIDGTCDMEGKGSVYNLPICIPCGNGICDNFEDRCNCTEDCGVAPKHGGTQRDLPFVYIKPSKKE